MKEQTRLAVVVFYIGAAVMIYELLGSRILGPYFGTSIFVWTSLIGIILGSLSLGYYLGGRASDHHASYARLAKIVLLAGCLIAVTLWVKDAWLRFLALNLTDLKVGALIGSLGLFAPASIALGMVSPYALRLQLQDLSQAGRTIGSLSAISTVGSIAGTFLAGFYLLPHFGTNQLLLFLALSLFVASACLYPAIWKPNLVAFSIFAILGIYTLKNHSQLLGSRHFVDVDTPYNRVWIYDSVKNGQKIRTLGINAENHSSMYLDSDELANDYTKFFHLARHFRPDFRSTLMLGGAGYSYPKELLRKYPKASIEVVEIDPGVTDLARRYFRLTDDPRLTVHHDDGRTFLNRAHLEYDVIFGDAFGSRYSIPFHLTTLEAVTEQYRVLAEGGVVVQNLISASVGPSAQFLAAEALTFQQVFPYVFIFQVQPYASDKLQNHILVAVKAKSPPSLISTDPEIMSYLSRRVDLMIPPGTPILTDDFAPVEYYLSYL